MNFNSIFGWLTDVLNWIETYLINGLFGPGFQVIKNGVFAYQTFKPLIDFFAALFGTA
ncbi:MAG: hypothetical protein FWF60_01180 [Oscillospiraceae bacterium]|nr:hypothetical protein [Oscillospiraceae bacterium]